MVKKAGVALLGLFLVFHAEAQFFNGVKGSIYSPTINTTTQPAAGTNMPYSWTVEVAGVDGFWTNNILSASPLHKDWKKDTIYPERYFLTGLDKRWGMVKADIHLLNFLFRLPNHKEWVIGGGWNIRTHTFADHLHYNYQDTMTSISEFLKINATEEPFRGRIINQQWMEWFVTASKILRENKLEKWTAGASLKLTKGMSAEIVDVRGLQLNLDPTGVAGQYPVIGMKGRYGYSANLEELGDKPIGEQRKVVIKGSPISAGIDIGVTYTRKSPDWIPGFTNDDPAAYEWKASLSLTDFGRLKYPLGKESRIVNSPKKQGFARDLQQALKEPSTLTELNDSLNQIAEMKPWEQAVSVSLPTQLHLSFDRALGHHLFIHAHLALDASFINAGVAYQSHTISYLSVAPRWEIKRLGVYAPLYISEKGRVLAGGAVRIGPVVAGLHDFGWLFQHTKNGGAYVSLVLKGLYKKKEDCPTF